MRYNANYKNQFFWDSNNDITFKQLWEMMKAEFATGGRNVTPPRSRFSKFITIGICSVAGAALVSFGISFLVTKGAVFALVIAMLTLFIFLGIFFIALSIFGFVILPKSYTEQIEAVCVGHSISGGGGNDGAGRPARCPVFEYTYKGQKYLAYDGIYDNTSAKPMIGATVPIMIDPAAPEELMWNSPNGAMIFLSLGGLFFIVLALAMLFVTLNDDNFMNQTIPARAEKVRIEEAARASEEALSEERRASEEREAAELEAREAAPELTDEMIEKTYLEDKGSSPWKIKLRILKSVRYDSLNDGYVFEFEEDPDFEDHLQLMFSDQVTDNMKNALPGDELYFIQETGDFIHPAIILSPKDHKYVGKK